MAISEEELQRRAREYVYNSLVDFIRQTKQVVTDDYYHEEAVAVAKAALPIAFRLTQQLDPTDNSNLVKHAQRELEIIGEDPDFIQHYLDVVRLFASQGHSGGSASVFIPTLQKLLNFENLTPVTDEPIEWQEVQAGLWQNVRNGSFFSKDGGRTYYNVEDKPAEDGSKTYYESERVFNNK